LNRLRDHRALQWLGLEPGVEPQVCGEIRNFNPGEAVNRMQRDQRHGAEKQDKAKGQRHKPGKRAWTIRMGTHRIPMLGRPSYEEPFRNRAVGVVGNRLVTIAESKERTER
jgi:hypothetical protein